MRDWKNTLITILLVAVCVLSISAYNFYNQIDENYNAGYKTGYSQGYDSGYDKGYIEGKDRGYKDGLTAYDYQLSISAIDKSTSSTAPVIKPAPSTTPAPSTNTSTSYYVLNTNTKKFHKSTCTYVDNIKSKNRKNSYASRESIINQGYSPCKVCKP